MSPDELQLLTIPELARLAKVHRSTIYRHEQAGLVHFIHMGPRSPRVALQEAERYLAGLGVTIEAPDQGVTP